MPGYSLFRSFIQNEAKNLHSPDLDFPVPHIHPTNQGQNTDGISSLGI